MLMQMVENVEECVLCACLSCQLVDVIDEQDVNTLIEIDEVIDLAFGHSRGVLALENSCRDIEYTCSGILFLDANADGLDEMCLPHASRPEDKHRVIGLNLGVVGYRHAHSDRKLVACAATVVLEGIARIELRVDVFKLLLLEGVAQCLRDNLSRCLELGTLTALGHG